MSQRTLALYVSLFVMSLFRDLWRALLALDGRLEWDPWKTGGLISFFPDWVSVWEVMWIPINVALIIYLWRKIEWKRRA